MPTSMALLAFRNLDQVGAIGAGAPVPSVALGGHGCRMVGERTKKKMEHVIDVIYEINCNYTSLCCIRG